MKKYQVKESTRFRREYRKMVKRGYDMNPLDEVVEMLESGLSLLPRHNDHALTGNFKGFRECHITPDWLLIYRIETDVLILVLQRTGTHSDLF